MLQISVIDDPRDPRVADFRALPDPERLRTSGLFVAEGRLVVQRLLRESSLRTRAVLATEPALAALREDLERAQGARVDGCDTVSVQVLLAQQALLSAIGGFNFHRGCLAIGERPDARDLAWLLARTRQSAAAEAAAATMAGPVTRLVVLEGVNNADNVGGIFRSAAALGASGVLVGPRCCDPLYRKAIRTSIGASLVLPFAHAHAWPDDLAALRRQGYRIVALTPGAAARPLDEVAEMKADASIAILAGAEGEGLSAEALRLADDRIRIRMAPGVDSLNVTVAVSIALERLGSRHAVS